MKRKTYRILLALSFILFAIEVYAQMPTKRPVLPSPSNPPISQSETIATPGPVGCITRIHEVAEATELSTAQKIKLCAGAEAAQYTAPLVCYERAEAFLETSLTPEQKVNLCAGARPKQETAPLYCVERTKDFSPIELSMDEKIALCAAK